MTTIPLDMQTIVPATPEGYKLRSAYAYPDYFNIPAGADADTVTWEGYTLYELTQSDLDASMASVKMQTEAKGHVIFGYCVWQKPIFNLSVPQEICILDQTNCWQLPAQLCAVGQCIPFAGQTVVQLTSYRFWMVSIPADQMPTAQVSAAVPVIGLGAAIVLVLGVLLSIGLIAGLNFVATGKIKWSDLVSAAKDVLKAPGQNVTEPIVALSWPLIALGVTIVAAAFVLPNLVARSMMTAGGGTGYSSGSFKVDSPKVAGGGVSFGGEVSSDNRGRR